MRSLHSRFVVLFFALFVAISLPAFAQDEIDLQDGLLNIHFDGAGTTTVTSVIPQSLCSGGTCTWQAGLASGTGHMLGTGSYTLQSPAMNCNGNVCEGPFILHVQADGSSQVTQTLPIVFNYTSNSGDLTGNWYLTMFTASDAHIRSVATGTMDATGGSFAQYFPTGGNLNITFGGTFPFQILWRIHGFSTVEINYGTITPNPVGCVQLTGSRYNRTGLPKFFPDDLTAFFTQSNNVQIPCSELNPCGSMDVATGTGGFTGDLVVTVQLSGEGGVFQLDRMGFNSDLSSGFALQCFAFGGSCSSGVGGAQLGGPKNEDGYGSFANTLYTGLNGGSGCQPDGTGCKTEFTFVVSNSNGPLSLSDFNPFVAAHMANGVCSGFIATPNNN